MRIASRQSPLAVAQAELVRHLLANALNVPEPLVEMSLPIYTYITSGDQNMSPSLADEGGKGLFTKEVEDALLSRKADIAVHSMKDMPAALPGGLIAAGVPARAAPNDAFVSVDGRLLHELAEGTIVGSSSTRRRAQLKRIRPDLNLAPMRGNVCTRLKKLASGDADGTFLAEAGLSRLGREDVKRQILPVTTMLPAIGQGTLCLEAREDDERTLAACALINCHNTALRNNAERGLLEALDGNCKTPLAGHAVMEGSNLSLQGELLTPDGSLSVTEKLTFTLSGNDMADLGSATQLGFRLAEALKQRAGADIERMLAANGS
ncbi:MAG: hydroxymethylbilane synthase [Pseudomonadota bacterium]